MCGLGLFIYQSLDAIDGKQARRTGSSSPLGELFDHGCDSVSTGKIFYSIIALLKSVNRIDSFRIFFSLYYIISVRICEIGRVPVVDVFAKRFRSRPILFRALADLRFRYGQN